MPVFRVKQGKTEIRPAFFIIIPLPGILRGPDALNFWKGGLFAFANSA